MDIVPLIKRLIVADAKHFGWGVISIYGIEGDLSNSSEKKDMFMIVFSGGVKVFDIPEDTFNPDIDYFDESDFAYGILRVASAAGMRILFWEEVLLRETMYFARIWKPNKSSQRVKEIAGNNFLKTICLAYLSNYE